MTPSERLQNLGLVLPAIAIPVGSYVPAVRSGLQIYTSGHLPMRQSQLVCAGKVASEISVEKAAIGARLAALNGLAAAASVTDGLDGIRRVVRVCVFVNSSPGFTDQPKVADGASDFLTEIFGDAGRHARSAVGVAELPLGAAVELELVVEAANS